MTSAFEAQTFRVKNGAARSRRMSFVLMFNSAPFAKVVYASYPRALTFKTQLKFNTERHLYLPRNQQLPGLPF
jgi:hypothetical protein